MKKVLTAGSIAYDHLMRFEGDFKKEILPNALKYLSISFQSVTEAIHYGGCAGNIAYNLKLLGITPLILAVAGKDFGQYAKWLKKNKISTKFIKIDRKNVTATAYLLNDKNHNQLTIFDLGAMRNQNLGKKWEKENFGKIDYGIISPDIPVRMRSLAKLFKRKGVPYILDPGQAITDLTRADLLTMMENCLGMIVNEYEANLLEKKTKISLTKMSMKMKFLIETLGGKGCKLYENGKINNIAAIRGLKVVDITGCGDAFRAGFIYGLSKGFSVNVSCKAGAVLASFVLEKRGTQNHKFTMTEFNKRIRNFLL